LKKHPGIITPDRDIFLDVLLRTDVPRSSKFYKKLPDNKQELKEADRVYFLSLRRVLRNRNVESGYKVNGWRKLVDAYASRRCIYSSDILTRRLRQDSEIVDLMEACEQDFSLLGKFEVYDSSNLEKLTVQTTPILVIPGSETAEKVLDWENANTTYQKGKESLRKVSLAEYMS